MDDRELLERIARTIPEPLDVMGDLQDRQRRRQRAARIRAGTVAVAMVVAVVALVVPQLLGTTGQTYVPVTEPSDPFVGTWVSVDLDGSSQRLGLTSVGSTYDVVLYDDMASMACGGGAAVLTGTAAPRNGPLLGLSVVLEELSCEGGRFVPHRTTLLFVLDGGTGRLSDSTGVTWSHA
jgi:hypothetical protein